MFGLERGRKGCRRSVIGIVLSRDVDDTDQLHSLYALTVFALLASMCPGHDSYIATLLICEFEIPRGLAAMISSPIAAALYERHHSEEGAGWGAYGLRGVIVFAGAMSLASAVLSLGLRATKKKKLQ